MNRFINEKKTTWKRLEELLAKTEGLSGLKGLPRAEVRELGELYRRSASDLAIARAETNDPKLIGYLNSLVSRAHGKIYRAETKGFGLIWEFFARDFPRTFRKYWKYTALSTSVFFLFVFIGVFLISNDNKFADVMGIDQIRLNAENDVRWWLSLNDANNVGASYLFTHNIRVALFTFAFGAILCVGSLFFLAFNGLHFGSIMALCYKTSVPFGNELASFVVAHGPIELFSIFLAGAAGMIIGYSIISPGDISRSDALRLRGLEAIKLVFGAAVILVCAGLIEGFISPSGLPVALKIATGVLSITALLAYLIFAGRKTVPVVE